MTGRKRTIIGTGVFSLVLPALFWLLQELAWFRQLRLALQSQTVTTGVLNYGEMGAILKDLGYVRLVANDTGRFPITDGFCGWKVETSGTDSISEETAG